MALRNAFSRIPPRPQPPPARTAPTATSDRSCGSRFPAAWYAQSGPIACIDRWNPSFGPRPPYPRDPYRPLPVFWRAPANLTPPACAHNNLLVLSYAYESYSFTCLLSTASLGEHFPGNSVCLRVGRPDNDLGRWSCGDRGGGAGLLLAPGAPRARPAACRGRDFAWSEKWQSPKYPV